MTPLGLFQSNRISHLDAFLQFNPGLGCHLGGHAGLILMVRFIVTQQVSAAVLC